MLKMKLSGLLNAEFTPSLFNLRETLCYTPYL
jgi:hypothetical protein